MFGVIKRRFKTTTRPIHEHYNSCNDDEKNCLQELTAPRFIKISDGKISLDPPKPLQSSINVPIHEYHKNQEFLCNRIAELEENVFRLEEKINNSECTFSSLEKNLKEQLENKNKELKSKEKKTTQVCLDQKVLQARLTYQENLLELMQQENKNLHQCIRNYERCLDDVIRKVVDALVAEDNLREEVAMLKTRVRDLEAQNVALCIKGRDEGYCTMSIEQLQPSNGQLEDLSEEQSNNSYDTNCDKNNVFAVNPLCANDMEDWRMSLEELSNAKASTDNDDDDDDDDDESNSDSIWNTSTYLNSTTIDLQSDHISRLLKETIVYSEDENNTANINFTNDFYKLINIQPGSTKSLSSYVDIRANENSSDDSNDEEISSDKANSPNEVNGNGFSNEKLLTQNFHVEKNQTQNEKIETEVVNYSPSGDHASPSDQVKVSHESKKRHKSLLKNKIQSDSSISSNGNPTVISEKTLIEISTPPKDFDKCAHWRRNNRWRKIKTQHKKESSSDKVKN